MMVSRNLTAYYIAHNYDSTLRDIVVVDESTGEEKQLGQFIEEAKIEQAHQGLSISDFHRKQKIKKLIKQAERRLKSGRGSDGSSAIRANNIDNITDAQKFNRYMSGRSKKAEFAASYQIHNSLNQYIEQNLFYHGLDSQPGFKSKGVSEVRPIIDGVINYQEWKNNPLAMRWVKENFHDRWMMMKGKKSWISQEGEGAHFLD